MQLSALPSAEFLAEEAQADPVVHQAPLNVPLRVVIERPIAQAPHAVETAGLAAMMLELHLGGVDGVIPVVGELELASFAGAPVTGPRWSVHVEVVPCPNTCWSVAMAGDASPAEWAIEAHSPAEAASVVANRLAGALQRTAHATYTEHVSADDYAQKLVGRVAATVYGWREDVPKRHLGHKRKDAFQRLSIIDPNAFGLAWMQARREWTHPDLVRGALERSVREGAGVLAKAELARLLDRPALLGPSVLDARFLGIAASERTEEVLSALPSELLFDPVVAEVAARATMASKMPSAPWLHRWAQSTRDPEPVRHLMMAALRDGDRLLAVQHAEELAARGEPAADGMIAALNAELGVSDDGEEGPMSAVRRGRAMLEDAPSDALGLARKARRWSRWFAPAIELEADALRRMGRFRDEERARRLLVRLGTSTEGRTAR